MKIRGDFVTNSSSVSYILTMNKDIVDGNIKIFNGTGIPRYLGVIKELIENNGELVEIGGKEIHYLKIDIDPSDITPMSEYTTYSTPVNIDFNELTDDEILSLFKWIITEDKTKNLYGIGATLIEDV